MMIKKQLKHVLVTGAQGFIGKNIAFRIVEQENAALLTFSRSDGPEELAKLVAKADAIVHLAGENRSLDPNSFVRTNIDLTRRLCTAISKTGRHIPLIFASSIQIDRDTPYGKSKLAAENVIENFSDETGNPVAIYRLPGVFGKWCKPNYNSVVATFCYNTARGLPINIDDPNAKVKLVYIDDVITEFFRFLKVGIDGLFNNEIDDLSVSAHLPEERFATVTPEYSITVGKLADQIKAFQECHTSLISERVGTGLTHALYATYISYLPAEKFSYNLHEYRDERGIFVEVLKTPDCGQFSFFSVYPGVTRGAHYHHTKTEKFIVISGRARMRFRQLDTGETYEVIVSGDKPQVVDTIPGWVHDITNIGESEVLVMLWANEVFNKQQPDSIPCEV
jgi:UDP-2-acetamido-2,6-beta-L-arabino-hexul-4-ose reductase